ncbi:MAG: hypothetical protein JNK11_07110 [Alphaproteobacteria bacterium]|nr:hypothetical protein [Alphaproteobacteria bacterium]
MNIVLFLPYAPWIAHSFTELTIALALKVRGCNVLVVGCDGAVRDCDMTLPSFGTVRPNCTTCRAESETIIKGFGVNYAWLGGIATEDGIKAADAWIDGLRDDELAGATYAGLPVGELVASSVHTNMRCAEIDPDDAPAVAFWRRLIHNGALTAAALPRVLDAMRPHALIVFNGRISSTRVAFEAARARGIRTIVEERAFNGIVRLFENETGTAIAPYEEGWRLWRDTPLSAPEIKRLAAYFGERLAGKTLETQMFSDVESAVDALRARLGIDPSRPVVTYFASSPDEGMGQHMVDPRLADMSRYVGDLVDYARARPDVQLILRAHPWWFARKATGSNKVQIAFFAELAARLPANAVYVPPEDRVLSYDLMRLSDVVAHWFSTTGIEAGMMGVPVVQPQLRGYSPRPHCRYLTTGTLAATLDELVSSGRKPGPNLETARHAWRDAYSYFYRTGYDFTPVSFGDDPYSSKLTYDRPEDLAPGKHADLDWICEAIMTGQRLQRGPQPADATRSAASEQAAIASAVRAAREAPMALLKLAAA